jgi:hypothetical protein
MLGHYIAGQLFGAFPSPIAMRIIACGGLVTMAVLGILWITTTGRAARKAPVSA